MKKDTEQLRYDRKRIKEEKQSKNMNERKKKVNERERKSKIKNKMIHQK